VARQRVNHRQIGISGPPHSPPRTTSASAAVVLGTRRRWASWVPSSVQARQNSVTRRPRNPADRSGSTGLWPSGVVFCLGVRILGPLLDQRIGPLLIF
jgi:hypothetical protein